MQHLQKLLVRLCCSVLVLYLLICSGMFLLQRQLLYHPDSRDIALDVALVPGAQVQLLQSTDGETLKTWWVPPADNAQPVYLYFPGNADTLAERGERFAYLVANGAGLLALSWRGYGGSTGSPAEVTLKSDAMLSYQWLREQVAPEHIILFGESLGTGAAVWLASTEPSAALVLDSAYTSIADTASQMYPWLPVRLLLLDTWNSIELASQIQIPVLAMHCQQDPLVPFNLGKQLFDAFTVADKHLEIVPRRCHVPSIAPITELLRQLEAR